FYLCHYSFLLCLLHPLSSTLFPYTTLFRSAQSSSVGQDIRARGAPLVSCQKNGWSRSVLIHQIESGLYQRQVLADKVSNFERRRSEEHTSELQSRFDLVCRLLLEKKKKK